jgi:hypothetical protein
MKVNGSLGMIAVWRMTCSITGLGSDEGLTLRMQKSALERRKWDRLPIAIPVFARGIDNKGKEFLDFTTLLNISAGGAMLATRRPLSPATDLILEIPSAPMGIPAFGRPSMRILRARIVDVKTGERCLLCGLEFTRPLVFPITPARSKRAKSQN